MENTAKSIMSKKLVTVQLDDSIRKSYQIMQERKFRHLPVVDVVGAIVGVLSDRDVRRAMLPKSGLEASNWDESSIEFDSTSKVSDFMSWPARIIPESTPVIDAARMMLEEKLSALIVSGLEARYPRGIVTTDDMLKLLVSLLAKGPSEHSLKLDSLDFDEFNQRA